MNTSSNSCSPLRFTLSSSRSTSAINNQNIAIPLTSLLLDGLTTNHSSSRTPTSLHNLSHHLSTITGECRHMSVLDAIDHALALGNHGDAGRDQPEQQREQQPNPEGMQTSKS